MVRLSVRSEFRRMMKEPVMVKFKVLSLKLPVRTEENHGALQSR
jgi:hypothetical protein